MFVDVLAQLWSEWGLRVYVISSLVANVLLSLLSGTRRRSAAGRWRSVPLWFVTRIVLWMAYQGAEIAATGALGSLSLCGSDASAEEQQVIAFWAPFLLVHLGGPDTMTAYAPEDNAMSVRKFAEMVFQVWGALYAQYKYIYRVRSWTLLATASTIMLPIGAARYVEKWYALWQSKSMKEDDGDDDDSSKKKEEEEAWSSSEPEVAGAGSTTSSKEVEEKLHDDDEALRLSQDLFHVCRRALADSSVLPDSEKQRASDKIFRLEWKSMCKVVEMELSLMYEALYTKAIVLHACPVAGYLIRLLSPLATAAAVLLFNQYIGSRRSRTIIRGSFVEITYVLLGVALAMDVVWLLRALGSTWTYAALKEARPWACWLRHHLLCSGRWRRLHRAVVALHPMSWLFCSDPVRYRTWSGTIGRYNLLHECSAAAAHHRRRLRPWWRRFCSWSWLKKKLDLEEIKYLSELPQDVKKLLIQRVRRILASTNKSTPADEDEDGIRYYYTMEAIRTLWGQQALKGAIKLFEGKDGRHNNKVKKDGKNNKDPKSPLFGREFEEDVLVWHMATCVFLSSSDKVTIPAGSSAAHVKAIQAMSEYLMFFVAVRRQMLPGLVLHSLFEKTLQSLGEIWDEGKKKTTSGSSSSTAAKDTPPPEDKLADMLLKKAKKERQWFLQNHGRLLVLDAAILAGRLINTGRRQQQRQRVPQLLEFIFNAWVDKLLYAAVRCSGESHAKQLSRGGDLTTILWMIIQHAGLFRVGEKRPGYVEPTEKKKIRLQEKKPEEKKKPPAAPMWPGWFGETPMPAYIPEEPPTVEAYVPQVQRDEGEEEPEDAEEYDDMPTGYVTLY